MSSKHAGILEANGDFVLKLKIKSTEGPCQIRRVRLPRLVDDSGDISYDELVGLCVTFTFPEESRENFEVTLTYFDIDDDTVTIASTDELIDAIEQFSSAKVLRLATEVKPKTKQAPRQSSAPGRNNTGSCANHEPINVNPQIKGALDTFVGVLSTAVRHLQEGLAAPLPEAQVSCGVPSAPRAEPAAASRPPAAAEPSGSPNNETSALFVHGRHTCDYCRTNPIVGRRFHAVNIPDFDLCEACRSSTTWDGVLFEEVELERDRIFQRNPAKEQGGLDKAHLNAPCTYPRDSDRASDEVPTTEDTGFNFIHGRHTCDSCLTTPIIGRRFHAMNLPDYDLCENCHSNYTGKEVRFEAAELDRDRPFQARWRRRFEKVEKLRGTTFQNRFHHKFDEKRRAEAQLRLQKFDVKCQEKFDNRFGLKGGEMLKENEKIAPRRGKPAGRHAKPRVPFRAHPCCSQPSLGAASMDRTNDLDDALKEAIRRSLRDIAPKEAELMEERNPANEETSSAAKVTSDEKVESNAEASDDDKKPAQASTLDAEVESVASMTEEETKPAPSFIAEKEAQMPIASSANDLELTIEFGNDEDQSVFGPEDTKDMEDAMEVGSVDSEKLLGADDERKPAAVEHKSPFQNDSFESDAAGNGDVAEAVGATLDLVAGMISDMLSETKSAEWNQESTMASSEAVIVQPEGSAKSEAASEDNEWEVVDEDGMGTETESKNDDIARAAEMLGSALYNSSTQDSQDPGSHGNVSNLSDSFSVPSTVPSINVSASQRARWCEHLSKLEELGFVDEPMMIEILERLQAADIGVESEDDVSITRVVHVILEERKT